MDNIEQAKKIFIGACCWSHLCKTIDNNISVDNKLIVTYPVCKSFLCELLLKSIITYEKHSFNKIHDLTKLFKLLNDETQSLITNAACKNMTKIRGTFDKNQFLSTLNANKDNFERWRYFYEKNQSADLDFINSLHTELANYSYGILGNNLPNKN